jgi:hypothetical protein
MPSVGPFVIGSAKADYLVKSRFEPIPGVLLAFES